MTRSLSVSVVRGLLLVWLLLAVRLAHGAMAKDAAAEKRELEAVESFLANKFLGMQWQRGPIHIKGAAVATAYPESRFYYVFSSQYPVARANQLSAMLRVDREGNVTHVATPNAYSNGLMKITGIEDAKTAAAAVMSLTFGPFGPVAVAADEVEVKADGKGWVCTAAKGKAGGMHAQATTFRVVFDGNGKCTAASHQFKGPLPICVGALFRVVDVSQPGACIGHGIGVALQVASVEPDSIAARAGLQPDDILISFAGRPLPSGDAIQQMRQIVYPLKEQGNVARPVKVLRCGEVVELTLRW
jgi:hypothetical protein